MSIRFLSALPPQIPIVIWGF